MLEHTGSEAFDAHLKGVQAVLRYWGSEKYLSDAGLFHSICECIHRLCGYFHALLNVIEIILHSAFSNIISDGTEGFQGFSLPLAERDAIR